MQRPQDDTQLSSPPSPEQTGHKSRQEEEDREQDCESEPPVSLVISHDSFDQVDRYLQHQQRRNEAALSSTSSDGVVANHRREQLPTDRQQDSHKMVQTVATEEERRSSSDRQDGSDTTRRQRNAAIDTLQRTDARSAAVGSVERDEDRQSLQSPVSGSHPSTSESNPQPNRIRQPSNPEPHHQRPPRRPSQRDLHRPLQNQTRFLRFKQRMGWEPTPEEIIHEHGRRFHHASELLLERLFKYLSQLPEEEVHLDEQQQPYYHQQPSQHPAPTANGITLPASAVAWLSSQMFPPNNRSNTNSVTRNDSWLDPDDIDEQEYLGTQLDHEATDNDPLIAPDTREQQQQRVRPLWMGIHMRDRLALLKFLLPRATHVRIVGNISWPPPLDDATLKQHIRRQRKLRQRLEQHQQRQQQVIGQNLHCSQISVNSTITMESMTTPSFLGSVNASNPPSLQRVQDYFYQLQHQPIIDLRVFPKLQVLLCDQIPSTWIRNLHVLSNTLQVFRMDKGCIYNTNSLLCDGTDVDDNRNVIYPAVTHLKLSKCDLDAMSGLRTRHPQQLPPLLRFPNLQVLNLSHNHLSDERDALTGLSQCVHQTKLDLSYNHLKCLSKIHRNLGNIAVLNLSHNQLTTVEGIDRLYSLRSLDLYRNNLASIGSVASLARLPELMLLNLKSNPLAKADAETAIETTMTSAASTTTDTTNPPGRNSRFQRRQNTNAQKSHRLQMWILFAQQRFTSTAITYDECKQLLPVIDGKRPSRSDVPRIQQEQFVERITSENIRQILSSALTTTTAATNEKAVTSRLRRSPRKRITRKAVIQESSVMISPVSKTTSKHAQVKPKLALSTHQPAAFTVRDVLRLSVPSKEKADGPTSMQHDTTMVTIPESFFPIIDWEDDKPSAVDTLEKSPQCLSTGLGLWEDKPQDSGKIRAGGNIEEVSVKSKVTKGSADDTVHAANHLDGNSDNGDENQDCIDDSKDMQIAFDSAIKTANTKQNGVEAEGTGGTIESSPDKSADDASTISRVQSMPALAAYDGKVTGEQDDADDVQSKAMPEPTVDTQRMERLDLPDQEVDQTVDTDILANVTDTISMKAASEESADGDKMNDTCSNSAADAKANADRDAIDEAVERSFEQYKDGQPEIDNSVKPQPSRSEVAGSYKIEAISKKQKRVASVRLYPGATQVREFDIFSQDWDALVEKAAAGMIRDPIRNPLEPTARARGTGKGASLFGDAIDLLDDVPASIPNPANSTGASGPVVHSPDSKSTNAHSSVPDFLSGPSTLPNLVFQDDHSIPSSLGASRDDLVAFNKFQLAEENSTYDGPSTCLGMAVTSNLDMYFRTFVFPTTIPDISQDMLDRLEEDEHWQITFLKYPRIQLWPEDRRYLESTMADDDGVSGLHLTDILEACEHLVRVWNEFLIPCGRQSLRRLPPRKSQRLGFHGDMLFVQDGPDTYSEARNVILCLSSSALYVLLDHDAVTNAETKRTKKFPRPIPKGSFFRDAPWPHSVARHPLETLKKITIGFGFQRLTLHFHNPVMRNAEPFVYVLLISNKLKAISILKDLQNCAKAVGETFETASLGSGMGDFVPIENDDRNVLEALAVAIAPEVVGIVLHYQILKQKWKHGNRGLVRRVCVVTDAKIFLMDEDYEGDGSGSRVPSTSSPQSSFLGYSNTASLGKVRYRLVDEASLNQIAEVQAANADPAAMTIVIDPLSKLSRTHRWRLVCRDSNGAERLVADIRKAIEMAD